METAKRTYDDTEIDLMEILQVILSKWIPIVAIGLLAAILAGVGTAFFITKKYTATASMYVYTNPKGTESGTITSADLAAADNLIKTYQAIVKSNAALEVVSARLNQEHPEYVEILFYCLAATLFFVNNTFAQYVPDEIIRITKAGGVEIVDYATAPKTHSSPSLTKNVAIGLLAGLLISAAFFVLRALLDTTIYSAEEIAKVTSCPVIGNIPHVEVAGEAPEPWNVSVKEEITHGN